MNGQLFGPTHALEHGGTEVELSASGLPAGGQDRRTHPQPVDSCGVAGFPKREWANF